MLSEVIISVKALVRQHKSIPWMSMSRITQTTSFHTFTLGSWWEQPKSSLLLHTHICPPGIEPACFSVRPPFPSWCLFSDHLHRPHQGTWWSLSDVEGTPHFLVASLPSTWLLHICRKVSSGCIGLARFSHRICCCYTGFLVLRFPCGWFPLVREKGTERCLSARVSFPAWDNCYCLIGM